MSACGFNAAAAFLREDSPKSRLAELRAKNVSEKNAAPETGAALRKT
jgi:hypothetical protein